MNSILDSRLFIQAKKLREYYQNPIIIILRDNSLKKIKNAAILGAISSLIIDYNVNVINLDSPKEIAEFIFLLAKREQTEKTKILIPKLNKNKDIDLQILNIVGSIYNIGQKNALELLKNFKNIKNVANADYQKLIKIKGIGKQRAKQIYEIFNKEFRKD